MIMLTMSDNQNASDFKSGQKLKNSELWTLKKGISYHRLFWNSYDCNMIGKQRGNIDYIYNMPPGSESERRHHHKYDFSVLQQKSRNKLLSILDFIKNTDNSCSSICSKCLWKHVFIFLLSICLHSLLDHKPTRKGMADLFKTVFTVLCSLP